MKHGTCTAKLSADLPLYLVMQYASARRWRSPGEARLAGRGSTGRAAGERPLQVCILPLSIFGACWLHDKSFGTSNKQVCLSASCLSSSCPRDEAAAALGLHADDCDEPAAAAAKWAEPLRQNGDCILRSASREWTSRLIEEGVARHVVRTTCLPFGLSFHDASRGSQPPHNIRHANPKRRHAA